MKNIREIVYTAIAAIVFTGLAYGMDQRIDQRVQQAIDASNEQRIEQRLQFFIMKKEMTGLSGEDRINQQILERQLKEIRSK